MPETEIPPVLRGDYYCTRNGNLSRPTRHPRRMRRANVSNPILLRFACRVGRFRRIRKKGYGQKSVTLFWHPQREFVSPDKASEADAASQCFEPDSAALCLQRRSIPASQCFEPESASLCLQSRSIPASTKKGYGQKSVALFWHPQQESNL